MGEAIGGVHAVEVLRPAPTPSSSDVGMPRMTGLEVVAQVREELPDTRMVLFTTWWTRAWPKRPTPRDRRLPRQGRHRGALIPPIVSFVHGDPVG